MRILCVEDDTAWFDRAVRSRLEGKNGIAVTHARTKSEAVEHLSSAKFDYLIADLAIPETDPLGSAAVEHGEALIRHILRLHPTLPVLVLSAQNTEDVAEELAEYDGWGKFWDGQRRNLVKVKRKRHLRAALEMVYSANDALAKLDAVEVDGPADTPDDDLRALKLFARCNDAAAVRCQSLKGGLSSSRVYRVELIDNNACVSHTALCKIDVPEEVDLEIQNYGAQVLAKLPVGAFPSYIDKFFAGCGEISSAFYQLAADHQRNFFELLRESDDKASVCVEALQEHCERWYGARSHREATVQEVRRAIFEDSKMDNVLGYLRGIDIEGFEKRTTQASFAIQHCDFHGANILVADERNCVIIDFADIREAATCIDPVTLELSVYFHPFCRESYDPSLELAEIWFDDNAMVKQSPHPATTRALREWARNVAYLKRDRIAATYGFALRQLYHDGTNKDFALAIVKSAIRAF